MPDDSEDRKRVADAFVQAYQLNNSPDAPWPFSPLSAAFDPAADHLLWGCGQTNAAPEVREIFDAYFRFGAPPPIEGPGGPALTSPLPATTCGPAGSDWPIPSTCLRLHGRRPVGEVPPRPELMHLFVGDVVWLYYHDEMGLLRIVQALLDDFESKGQHPFERQKLYALVLETMVRERRTYLGTRPLDRESVYRQVTGWKTTNPPKSDSVVNVAFAENFDQLMGLLGRFYRERELAVQIKESVGGVGPSPVGTVSLMAIQDALRLLNRAMRTFRYGRNYTSALTGIVYVVAGLWLTREVRDKIGVPTPFTDPDQYVPAAYDVLIEKGTAITTKANRYLAYRSCAQHARDLLIDIEVLQTLESDEALLRAWLNVVDTKVLAYTSAYQALYDVDLAAGGKHRQRA